MATPKPVLQVSHLVQHFGGGVSSGVGTLAARSFLGGLLPESLLYVLTTSGPQAFAAAMVGDSDSPELVWTHRMRAQRLVPQMHQHVGELAQRLGQFCHKVWEYVACPPMAYPELAEEMWCHRYYLRNLCDEDRFPNWPIVDHVQFLQVEYLKPTFPFESTLYDVHHRNKAKAEVCFCVSKVMGLSVHTVKTSRYWCTMQKLTCHV